jgi:hypothetical protein
VIFTGLLALAYAAISRSSSRGWGHGFLVAAIPSAAVVTSAYALAYFLFFRRGLTRDQRLVEAISERVTERLGRRQTCIENVLLGTAQPDWAPFFEQSDRVHVAARSLARWSTLCDSSIRAFLEAGGSIRVFSHNPDSEANLKRAAYGHAGYLSRPDPERVRSNVLTGLGRLAAAAQDHHPKGLAGGLEVRLISHDEFVFTMGLFVFEKGGELSRVVLRPLDNVRHHVTAAGVFVLDGRGDAELADFASRELIGFEKISRVIDASELRRLVGLDHDEYRSRAVAT